MTYINSVHLPSSSEMALYDKATIEKGIPSLELMERAGRKMSQSLFTRFISGKSGETKVLVLCGSGNNGGDGLVAARYLKEHCPNLSVIRIKSEKYSEDNDLNYKQYEKSGGTFVAEADRERWIKSADIIVDALLGIGQEKAPRGEVLELLKAVSKHKKESAKIISLDVPTGVDAESGRAFDHAINADWTLTVEFIKRGMMQYPAKAHCGKIDTLEVGIEASKPSEFQFLAAENIPQIKKRKPDSHKGSFGHVLVIGGSKNYPGAPVLSSHAALKAGAGLVTYAALSSSLTKDTYPELMFKLIKDTSGYFKPAYLNELKKSIESYTSFVVGPGLGQEKATFEFFTKFIKLLNEKRLPVVIDADGLNFLSVIFKGKNKKKIDLSQAILTPHPGEMARLLGTTIAVVQEDRYKAAKKLASLTSSVVVLKGAGTIVYADGRGYVNITGNPYMASGGSGDVLAGMIGSFIAQGYDNFTAAMLAVYLHGMCADLNYKKVNAAFLASDIIGQIPIAISKLQ